MRAVYLDSCALQRPLDRLVGERERAEAYCVTTLMAEVLAGSLILCWSDALDFECFEKGPMDRHTWIAELRSLAARRVAYGTAVRRRAEEFRVAPFRLKDLDALHLALAEQAFATLITVDRRFLQRCRALQTNLSTEVMDPIEAVARLVP